MTGTSGAASRAITVANSVASSLFSASTIARHSCSVARWSTEESSTLPTISTPAASCRSTTRTSSPASVSSLRDERENLAAKAHLPGAQNQRGVFLVASIRNERACLHQPADIERILLGAAEDGGQSAFENCARRAFVGVDDDRGDVMIG